MLGKMWQSITDAFRRTSEALKKLAGSPQARGRVGYYGGLALLLAMLGTASWSWRTRRQSASPAQEQPPRAAISVVTPTLTPAPTAEPNPWVWPLEGECLGAYAPDTPLWSSTLSQWQTHPGLDISGAPGEAVYACRDGTVADAWLDRLWGNVVAIDHGEGYRSTYAGLNTLEMVSEGDVVRAGDVIGAVGRSAECEADLGWHLHFEVTHDGNSVDFSTLVGAR